MTDDLPSLFVPISDTPPVAFSVATVYGSAENDYYLLQNPESLPRYSALARKALLHYCGDRYDPHKYGFSVEPFIRSIINELVTYKVFNCLSAYDWEWIDHTMRKAIGGCMGIDLLYSQTRIDKGFSQQCQAARQINMAQAH